MFETIRSVLPSRSTMCAALFAGTLVVLAAADARAQPTVELQPSVQTGNTQSGMGIRTAAMAGQLKYALNEREIITRVVVTATTTDGRTLICEGGPFPGQQGYTDRVNPTNGPSRYEGYVYDYRLRTFQISVTFSRYYRMYGNWYFDRSYTVRSSRFTYP